MEKMHMLKETLSREVDKIAGKGSMSSGDLETIFKLLMAMKAIYKIEEYEEEEYSHDGGYSGRRGRRRYSRGSSYNDGMSYEGNSYNDGMSYENRGYSGRRGRGSRGNSYSMHDAKHEMMEEMKELMEMEGIEPRDREVLRKAMAELGR